MEGVRLNSPLLTETTMASSRGMDTHVLDRISEVAISRLPQVLSSGRQINATVGSTADYRAIVF